MHNHIKRISQQFKPRSRYLETEKTRDRVTTRITEVFHHLDGIDKSWAGIKSLIRVERIGTRGGKRYHEVVCYISSLIDQAKEFACGIRGHWSIENSLHWVKDVILNEDKSRISTGNAPCNLSILRAIAMNLLRQNGHTSITIAHRFLSNDIDKLLSLME